MISKRQRLTATVVLLSACALVGRAIVRGRPPASRYQTEQPAMAYTLQAEILSLTHGGAVHRRQTIAVRSDGSRSTTETILGARGLEAGEIKRSLLFADGRAFTIFPSLQVKNTWPIHSRRPSDQAPPQDCVYPGWSLVERASMEGQDVAVVSHTSELGWKVTAWRAPQLGCETLRYISYDRAADGSFVAHTERRTVALRLGEPDPSLFDEAPAYREATPTEVGQMFAEKYHLTLTSGNMNFLGEFDKTYLGKRDANGK